MKLEREKCKLMTPELVEEFDRVAASAGRAVEKVPSLGDAPGMKKVFDSLERLKRLMERERYLVGFLGRSQVGKSTTLNRVLRCRKGEEPCTGGAGAPATSTVTRLYIKSRAQAEANPGVQHLCTLRYMTPEQFARRREVLCEYLGYAVDDADPGIIKAIQDQLARRKGAHGGDDLKDEDRRYFSRLLRSHREFHQRCLRSPALVEPGRFEDRAKYTNHPEDDSTSPYLLLSEVEIAYEKGAIDDRIELIDLPGLGARLGSDDLLTKEFLPELSGALIFQSAEQVAAREAYELLHMLRKQYRRLTGRVWMVITKFDTLAQEHYGVNRTSNIFDNIRKTMDDNDVPVAQVLLAANVYHGKLLGPAGELRSPSPEEVAVGLNLELGDDGQPVVPASFRAHAELAEAFSFVMRDGGIERVREVIGRTLAQEVEREVRDDVRARLREVRTSLAQIVSGAREMARGDDKILGRVRDWRLTLKRIIDAIDLEHGDDAEFGREFLDGPGKDLAVRLRNTLTQELFAAGLRTKPGKLRAAHANAVKVLRNQALAYGRGHVLPTVLGRVAQALEAREAEVGPVRLAEHDGPLQSWLNFQREEPAAASFAAEVEAFDSSPPFPDGDGPPPIDDLRYRAVMEGKIQVVVHRAIHSLGGAIRGRLEAIDEELQQVSALDQGDSDAGVAVFDQILAELA